MGATRPLVSAICFQVSIKSERGICSVQFKDHDAQSQGGHWSTLDNRVLQNYMRYALTQLNLFGIIVNPTSAHSF